jgi:hypothetical protein
MNILKAIWKGGQVVLEGHADWPEGRRLIIREEPLPEIEFMTEDEQSDDPEAIQQWIDDLRTIPPVPENPAKEAERQAWEEKMRSFNIEAVRKAQFSLVAAGNTANPALLVLKAKGYELQVEQEGDEATIYMARKDGREFLGYSAAELLGLVTLWENLGDDWNQQESDVLTALLDDQGAD